MKRILGAGVVRIIAACALMAFAGAAAAQTAEEIMDANIKAIGGMDAIGKIKSVSRKAELAVDGAFGQMAGTQESVVIPGKKAYQSMDLGVFMQKMAYNGEVAWQDGMQGLMKMEGPEADQIRTAVVLNPFAGIRSGQDKESKVEKLEDETVGEVEFHVLQMSAPGSETPVKLYVNKETKMLDRTTVQQNNPQFGEVTIAIENSDYADYAGVKMPNKTKIQIGDMLSIEQTYNETKINEQVDESIFEMPTPPPAPPAAPAAETPAQD